VLPFLTDESSLLSSWFHAESDRDHHNTEKENQKEETLSQRERVNTLQAQPSEEMNGDIPLGCSGRTTLRREQCDSTPETVVTSYEQRIVTQRFKAIPPVTKTHCYIRCKRAVARSVT
jgi:hypothetical protein